MTNTAYVRKPKNINSQFWPYLFSSFFISVMLALNECLNGIIVSNLLGGQALAVINLTIPLTMAAAALYTLCGFGAAVATGNLLGKRDTKEAGKVFTVSITILVILGAAFSLFGVVFRGEIAAGLAGESLRLKEDITNIVGIMSIGWLFLLFTPFMGYFIKVEGKPGLAVLLMAIANILNIALTVLFISVFQMGVEAAALSVVIGYFISFIVFCLMVYTKKTPFRLTKISLKDFRVLAPKLATGLPAAVSLLLFAVQINVMNRLSFLSAGVDGVVIYSVCLGAYSIACIFYQGVTDTLPPILSVLRGAKDANGQRFIIKRVFLACTILFLCSFTIFGVFPQFMIKLYGIEPRLSKTTVDCIRLFALGMSAIVYVFFFLDYLQSIERKNFSMVISLLKNVVCILPLGWLFSKMWGIHGIMLAFSVGTALTVFIIALHNLVVSKRSGGQLKGLLLLAAQCETDRFEATIPINENAVVELSQNVEIYCAGKNADKKTSYFLSLAVEELAMFIIGNRVNSKNDSIDVFLTLEETTAVLIFCVSGKPFDVFDYCDNGSEEITNMMVLKNISDSISFERILLMNRTIISFNTQSLKHSLKP